MLQHDSLTFSRAEGPALGRGVLLILASTAIYGSTPALVSLANRSVDLIDLIFYRSFLAACLLALLGRFLRPRPPAGLLAPRRRRQEWRGIVLGSVLYAPHMLLFLGSLHRLSSSLAVAIGYVYPSFVVVLIAGRNRRLPARSDVGVLFLALLGVLAVAAPAGGSTVDLVGVLMVLAASALFAIYAVAAADLAAEANPIRLGTHLMFGAAMTTGTVGLLTGQLTFNLGTGKIILLAAHATLAVAGVLAYTSGLALVGAARASLIDTSQPVVALVVGMVLLSERPGLMQYVGVLLIIGSISLMALFARRPQPPIVDAI